MLRATKDRRAEILKALAHPVRLGLVETLSDRRLCVNDLAGLFPVDRTTISKHLAVLKDAGVLEDERSGREVYYRLRLPCLQEFIACLGRMSNGGEREVSLCCAGQGKKEPAALERKEQEG
ncbi:MAG TPA: metalloregulator ArsR/SmtB family transcription factor [Synergistales bacterium]|nr:metalloregulator ArsR/SmtB family transcription factor [Synergistales bacterium]